jgi:hypothetical protein
MFKITCSDSEQVIENTGMNTKEISLNYSPKKLTKHLKSDAVWGV